MELIDREKLKASIRSMVELPNEARAQVTGAINREKAIDIVRCKDCKEYNGHRWCTYFDQAVLDNDFCSYGERKVEDGKTE